MRRLSYLLLFLVLAGCSGRAGETQTAGVQETVRYAGGAMGTTYSIVQAASQEGAVPQARVDSLLDALNASLSTYIPSSIISDVNASTDTSRWFALDDHFAQVMTRSAELHERSGGAFNPAIGPLIDAWGFGAEGPTGTPSEAEIDRLLAMVDFSGLVFDASRPALKKGHPEASLNFNAIAKGYGVDIVGELIESHGITDYFVEIGGEVRTRGMHPEGRAWRVGIERPADNMLASQAAQQVAELGDAAMATSGNYRNYIERDGQRFAHIIDPASGRPETTSVLSATVIAPDCMTADAWATAFVVMGATAALELVESDPTLEAYFILAGEGDAYDIRMSSGMSSYLAD